MEDKTKAKAEKKLIESEGSGKCCGRKGESENSRKEKANVSHKNDKDKMVWLIGPSPDAANHPGTTRSARSAARYEWI